MSDDSQQSLKALIAYNEPNQSKAEGDWDYLSEEAVKEEAAAVYQNLLKLGHTPRYLPLADLAAGLQTIKEFNPNIIFNLCEGFRGNARHEMHVAGIWEILGIPYTGNVPVTLGLSQNKVLSKKLFESRKIPTPAYQVYRKPPEETYLSFPLIAKPAREDASLGITQDSVMHSLPELKKVVGNLLEKYRQPILVEKYIPGREFNVSILGNHSPRVLAISEIDFSKLDGQYHAITSYEAKWLTDHPIYRHTPAIVPAQIEAGLVRRLEDVALRVYQLLIGRDYGRVDVRVDEEERIFVLEYNPNPDISPDAGYSRALTAAGIEYYQFIEFLINEALHRREH
jgi:D-alanine-D-alanine ligase